MRSQLCLILEPKWFKLTTCDWIRRILNKATRVVNISAENILGLLLLLIVFNYTSTTLLVKYDWYFGTKPELFNKPS